MVVPGVSVALNRRQAGLIQVPKEELVEAMMVSKKAGTAAAQVVHRRMLDRYRISFPSLNRENLGKDHKSRQPKTILLSPLAHYTRLVSQTSRTFTQTVAQKQVEPTRQPKPHLLHPAVGEDLAVVVTRASLLWVSPIQLGLSIRLRHPTPLRPLARLLIALQ